MLHDQSIYELLRMVYAADDCSNPASATDASTYTVPYNGPWMCAHYLCSEQMPNRKLGTWCTWANDI